MILVQLTQNCPNAPFCTINPILLYILQKTTSTILLIYYLFKNSVGFYFFVLRCEFQVCGVGWTRVYGSCYRLLFGSVTQSTAQANYLAIGASLALVTSAEKHAAVQDFIQSEGISPLHGVWVDGSDAAEEGVWRTAAGDVMSYLGFTGVEPNGGSSENCILLEGGSVYDDGCDRDFKNLASLCEH